MQRLDLVAHHVQADSAPRVLRRLGLGREARPEDELVELLGRHVRQLSGRNQRAAQGRIADLFQIEPGAVVRHLDEQHVALLLDADVESAFAVLAARLSLKNSSLACRIIRRLERAGDASRTW